MSDPFRSARLFYRAVEPESDVNFFLAIQTDSLGYQNSNARIAVPQSREDAIAYMRRVANDSLLGVVICRVDVPSEPIGVIHLEKVSPVMAHCRHTEIGIDILPHFQGKGYGSEAIAWALDWAFSRAAMHRVQIRCFEYNHGAEKLYRRLGFQQEGQWKDFLWHDGRFWDDLQFVMLAKHWETLKASK